MTSLWTKFGKIWVNPINEVIPDVIWAQIFENLKILRLPLFLRILSEDFQEYMTNIHRILLNLLNLPKSGQIWSKMTS